MTTRAKQIRIAAQLSQSAAAALAGVSPTTWRIYEASPAAVSEAVRAACELALERMTEIAARAA